MIKKRKIIKLLLLSIFLILIFITNINMAKADGRGGSTGGSGKPGGGNTDTPPKNPGAKPQPGGSCYYQTCDISTSYYIQTEITVDMYDMYGNEMHGVFDSSFSNKILAGTYVGLDVYETKSYKSSASYEYHKYKKVCECRFTDPCAYYRNGKCVPDSYTRKQDCGCSSGHAAGCSWVEISGNDSACAAQAIPPVITLNPSYNVSYRDSNDIDAKPSNDKYYTATTITKENAGNCNESSSSSGKTRKKEGTCTFTYNREKTCINVKNGKVRYINNDEQCDESIEYTIKSEDSYWKYFIPLNTNSAEGFSFTLNSSGKKEYSGICENLIDKYDDYYNLIVDSNRNPLPKITSDMNKAQINSTKRLAKALVEKGCYYQTTIEIPIEQKFYNEVNNGHNFNGFNFYYKPIDITNPFPNGLNDTSLWYEWNESSKKEPDLTESYDEVTYIATTSGNENTIRNYTKDNKYATWDNMYINGISGFIENEGIVTRKVAEDSFYDLGCGPNNSDLEVSNVFYQKECNNS